MKTIHLKSILLLSLMIVLFSACDDDDDPSSNVLQLNISGLENLGSDYNYEGWLITEDGPVTSGIFSVDDDGNLSKTSFEVDESDLEEASAFVLTIEPNPDPDPAPSDVHILAGDFSGNEASLSIGHSSAINTDFSSAMGEYIIATPTDGMGNNENSGIWFLEMSSGAPMASLSLPTLPDGWAYEGWVVLDGTPVSTGTFTDPAAADNAAPYSGNMGSPPFPGEDLLMNAPSGLMFPTDLSGANAVISVEPVPDNSAAPFLLKPLAGQIPQNITNGEAYSMGQNLVFPEGSAMK